MGCGASSSVAPEPSLAGTSAFKNAGVVEADGRFLAYHKENGVQKHLGSFRERGEAERTAQRAVLKSASDRRRDEAYRKAKLEERAKRYSVLREKATTPGDDKPKRGRMTRSTTQPVGSDVWGGASRKNLPRKARESMPEISELSGVRSSVSFFDRRSKSSGKLTSTSLPAGQRGRSTTSGSIIPRSPWLAD